MASFPVQLEVGWELQRERLYGLEAILESPMERQVPGGRWLLGLGNGQPAIRYRSIKRFQLGKLQEFGSNAKVLSCMRSYLLVRLIP